MIRVMLDTQDSPGGSREEIIDIHRNIFRTSNPVVADAIAEFQEQEDYKGSLRKYYEIAEAIADERRDSWKNSNDYSSLFKNVSEIEFILCAVNSSTDAETIIQLLKDKRIPYPANEKHLQVPKEEFIKWLEIDSLLNRWALTLYSTEGSVANMIENGKSLTAKDYEDIEETFGRALAFLESFHEYPLEDLGLEIAAKAKRFNEAAQQKIRECTAAIRARDQEALLMKTDRAAAVVAKMISTISFRVFGRKQSASN